MFLLFLKHRRDFDHIEYKLSYGYRQLEVLRSTGVTGASSFTVQRIQTVSFDEVPTQAQQSSQTSVQQQQQQQQNRDNVT